MWFRCHFLLNCVISTDAKQTEGLTLWKDYATSSCILPIGTLVHLPNKAKCSVSDLEIKKYKLDSQSMIVYGDCGQVTVQCHTPVNGVQESLLNEVKKWQSCGWKPGHLLGIDSPILTNCFKVLGAQIPSSQLETVLRDVIPGIKPDWIPHLAAQHKPELV